MPSKTRVKRAKSTVVARKKLPITFQGKKSHYTFWLAMNVRPNDWKVFLLVDRKAFPVMGLRLRCWEDVELLCGKKETIRAYSNGEWEDPNDVLPNEQAVHYVNLVMWKFLHPRRKS